MRCQDYKNKPELIIVVIVMIVAIWNRRPPSWSKKKESVNLVFSDAAIKRSRNKGMYDDENVKITTGSKHKLVVVEDVNDSKESDDDKVDYCKKSIFNTYANFGYNSSNDNNSKGNTRDCDTDVHNNGINNENGNKNRSLDKNKEAGITEQHPNFIKALSV